MLFLLTLARFLNRSKCSTKYIYIMAKVTFTAELTYEISDASGLTEEKAYKLLQDGMSPWRPHWAPHVTVEIKGGTIDGRMFEK